jgi:hypothetical protein
VYGLLYDKVVAHYQKHRPPGDPQVPAQQYSGGTSAV